MHKNLFFNVLLGEQPNHFYKLCKNAKMRTAKKIWKTMAIFEIPSLKLVENTMWTIESR